MNMNKNKRHSPEEVRKLFNEYVERVRQVERDNKEAVSEEELDSFISLNINHPFRVNIISALTH